MPTDPPEVSLAPPEVASPEVAPPEVAAPDVAALQRRVAQLERINLALMDRVEGAAPPSSFALFERNIELESLVRRRTHELDEINARLHDQITLRHRDPLTRLCNRELLGRRLSELIERRRGEPAYRFALLILDFDQFMRINDSLGHDVGDLLLIHIAHRLREVVGDATMIARISADEFVVIVDEFDDASVATRRAQQLVDTFERAMVIAGQRIISTVSIGVVFADDTHHSGQHLLRDADVAMLRAKAQGKCRVQVFDEPMRQALLRRVAIEKELRQELWDEQFSVHYQPVVRLEDGAIDSFEALLRWTHPTLGRIGPDEFIPVAEDLGVIRALGQWVLRQACEQVVAWDRLLPVEARPGVKVNVSKRQLLDADLVDKVRTILDGTGLAPRRLQLEVTETAIMEHPENMVDLLQALRDLGVGIAMDDFGTGYSSLSLLNRFPIDMLKIDRGFIASSTAQVSLLAVVQAIIVLAKNLRMQVVAEGLEDADQVAWLKALDCDFGQGYYFARPMPAAAVSEFLLASLHGDQLLWRNASLQLASA